MACVSSAGQPLGRSTARDTVTASPGGRGGGGAGSPVAVSGLTYTFTLSVSIAVGTGAESPPSNAVAPFGPERAHPDPPAETPRADVPTSALRAGPRVPPPTH